MALASVPYREYAQTDEEVELLSEIEARKAMLDPDMARFAALCDRFDNLYFPETVLAHAGASHWAEHRSAHTAGMSHISVNVPPVYVDIPASLQSVPPIQNMLALVDSEEMRQMASMAERLYGAWLDEESIELKGHQACIVKALYGRTAAKVWWDDALDRPVVRIVDQPRNLYLGWSDSDYTKLDWALYTYRLSTEAVYAEYGLRVEPFESDNTVIPFVVPPQTLTRASSERYVHDIGLEVQVYDYWYRRPRPVKRRKKGVYKPVGHDTWNCIFVGNVLVKQTKHPEYDGKMPYVPLFNTYLPGLPEGRPELYDVEALIREKDERLTQGAQLLTKAIDGQLWQLVGPEAPDVVPREAIPKPNKVAAPGPGNRIEGISPWMPEFQLEAFLSRLDREMADVTGLNDLLRGLAPAQVLSSSKAINALVANYEARIRLKRDLYYQWRRDLWGLTATIWGAKMATLRPILIGAGRLSLTAPSLTPRDDLETASLAANLVNAKLWSQIRGMDKVGVDDPESEQTVIREERTDASMFPADVQVMAQLMLLLQQLGIMPQQQAEAQGQLSQAQTLAAYRQPGGGQGSPMLNAPEEQVGVPPEGAPANTPEGEALTGPTVPPPEVQGQTLVQEGEASNRIVSTQSYPVG